MLSPCLNFPPLGWPVRSGPAGFSLVCVRLHNVGTESARLTSVPKLLSSSLPQPSPFSVPALSVRHLDLPGRTVCYLMPLFLVLTFFLFSHRIFLLLSLCPTLKVQASNRVPQTGCLNRGLFPHQLGGWESRSHVCAGGAGFSPRHLLALAGGQPCPLPPWPSSSLSVPAVSLLSPYFLSAKTPVTLN